MAECRLAWFATHPIQYQAPLLRAIAATPGVDLTAFFFSDFSTRAYVDAEFGRAVEWDMPLLDGYRYEFVPSRAPVDRTTFTRPVISGLGEILTARRFDAVLVQGWSHYGYVEAAWRARRAGLRVLLRCEATDHVTGSVGLKRAAREALVGFLFRRVDRFLAIGAHNRAFYLRRGIPAERIGAMPYCVDNDLFGSRAQIADVAGLRRELDLDSRPVLLYASKLTRRKHADDLVAAYRKLAEPRPYLLVVGDGELRGPLESAAADLPEVRFLGFRNQTELPAYYALADVFVLPSVDETWGLVVNEAMTAGCAIVASDQVGSAADLIRQGENGFVVPARNVEALSAALAATMEGGRYRGMGERSREIIETWGIRENVAGLVDALTGSQK